MRGEIDKSLVSWRFRVRQLAVSFVDFVFPPVCASCGRAGTLLCETCVSAVSWMEEPICLRCGRTTSKTVAVCSVCRQYPLPLEKIRAAVLFVDPIPPVIHKLKYKGQFGLARPLADLMAQAWRRWQLTADLLVPVPLHPERERTRGYNQSALLVSHLAGALGIPAEMKALCRAKNTRPQVGLNAVERQENMRGAFTAVSPDVQGKNILLVDDVCTTGATLASAAEALLEAGANSVSAYCLARAIQT